MYPFLFVELLLSAIVTLESIEIYTTHEWTEWISAKPTVYFLCIGENKTVLPDVKKTKTVYTFKGEESFQVCSDRIFCSCLITYYSAVRFFKRFCVWMWIPHLNKTEIWIWSIFGFLFKKKTFEARSFRHNKRFLWVFFLQISNVNFAYLSFWFFICAPSFMFVIICSASYGFPK